MNVDPATLRHARRLGAMQEDQKIKAADEDYLARHQIKDLMAAMLQEVVMRKPLDPVQYLVDYLTLDPSLAAQDENGVSAYRRARLLEVFKVMDADGDGKVNFKECQGFTGKHGGKVLSETELSAIFGDIDSSMDALIDEDEFVRFFSRVVRTMGNPAFNAMIDDMLL